MSKPTIFAFNDLLGGADGALDSIDGGILVDKDLSVGVDLTNFYPYQLDDDSGAAENSPLVVKPDANAGNKRWLLKSGVFAGLTMYGNIVMPDGGTIGHAAGPLLMFSDPDKYLKITGCSVNILRTIAGGETRPLTLQNADNTTGTAVALAFAVDTTFAFITGKIANLKIGANDYQMAFYTSGAAGLEERVRINELGFFGIGTPTPKRLFHIETDKNAISGSNIDVSELTQLIRNPADDTGEAVGIGFGISADVSNVGGVIIFERTGSQSQGALHFATKLSGGVGADIPIRMTINDDGGILMLALKSGTTQGGAGAAAGELWVDTDDENTIKLGV